MLIRQIKIALSDIFHNIGMSIVFIVQIFLCFLLCGYVVSEVSSISTLKNQLDIIGNISNIYYLIDVTEINRDNELSEKEDISERLYELFEHMQYSDVYDVYRFYPTVREFVDSRMDTSLAVDKFEGSYGYNVLYADVEYLDLFGIECSEGQLYSNEYVYEQDIIPVLAGHSYKEIFNLGDIIDGKYEIVGFIKENAFIINLNWTDEICYLDSYFVRPFEPISKDSDYIDIYQSVVRSLIITDDNKSVIDIPEHSLNLNLYTFNIRSYATQLEKIINDILTEIMMILVIMSIILIVCIVCMYTVLLVFINKHIREFTLHIMCGCTFFEILLRVCLHVLIPMLLSYLLTMIIFQMVSVAIVLAMFSLLLSCITLIPPFFKIYKNGLISVIGRTE